MAQRTKEEIEQLLSQYHQRGDQTRRGFCESRGVSLGMLDYYLRHYGKSPARVRLARVELKEALSPGCFALILSNGRRIECSEGGLAQLIRTAESL